jgi:hypothetical protein
MMNQVLDGTVIGGIIVLSITIANILKTVIEKARKDPSSNDNSNGGLKDIIINRIDEVNRNFEKDHQILNVNMVSLTNKLDKLSDILIDKFDDMRVIDIKEAGRREHLEEKLDVLIMNMNSFVAELRGRPCGIPQYSKIDPNR